MKDSFWKGMGISIGVEFLFFISLRLSGVDTVPEFLTQALFFLNMLLRLALVVWAVFLIIKYNKSKFGIGIFIGFFIIPIINFIWYLTYMIIS